MTNASAANRLRVGSAPDSWGVWFPDDENQPPWRRFLDEVAEAGYEWIELGPHGYLPTDPSRLRDELGSRELKLSAGTSAQSCNPNSPSKSNALRRISVSSAKYLFERTSVCASPFCARNWPASRTLSSTFSPGNSRIF